MTKHTENNSFENSTVSDGVNNFIADFSAVDIHTLHSIKNNLKGLENLIGVPGTLGGALIMNAGAWGGEISNCLESVELIDPDKNEVVMLSKSEIDFSDIRDIERKIEDIMI